jgi:aminoglycoside 6'-N-acetyltransferase
VIKGTTIAIRPVQRDDLPTLAAWTNDTDVNGEFNDFGLQATTGLEAGFNAKGLIDERQGTLMIVTLEGAIVGALSYHQVHYGPNSGSIAFNIGLHLVPAQRGKGYGSQAQRLLADYLLRTYPIGRVEAQTDIENTAEQHALERAGFRREGVLRKAQWRAGDWHDLVVYSRVRGDE